MAAAAVVFEQLADVDGRGRVEDVVADGNRRGILALGVVGDLDLDIAFGKQREDQEAIAVGNLFDAAQIAVDHFAFIVVRSSKSLRSFSC